MKAEVFYWKDIGKWLMNVQYNNIHPTKEDIEKDYVKLPIDFTVKKDESELNRIFAILNYEDNPLGTPKMQQWIRDNGLHHTSMSVGDIIKLENKKYFICKNEGWEELK